MKARTLISRCQSAPRNPSHGDSAAASLVGLDSEEDISDSVTCRYLSLPVVTRRHLSLPVVTCRYPSSPVVTCRATAGNAKQRAGVPGNHQFFVGRNNPG